MLERPTLRTPRAYPAPVSTWALSALLMALAVTAAVPAHAGDAIFVDDFERGDLAAWSQVVGGPPISPCVEGPTLDLQLEGSIAPAPPGPLTEVTCLSMHNDRPFERRRETANSGISLPRGLGLTSAERLVLVGPNGRRLSAQFDVLSRWGGPLDDDSLPIRWLGVSVQPAVAPEGRAVYALRLYDDEPPPPVDLYAATVGPAAGGFEVDTGVATFTLDPTNPALLTRIEIAPLDDGVGRQTVYAHSPGSGPAMAFDPGSGEINLGTGVPGQVVVDPGSFEIVEDGPVKVVASLRGHFSAPGGGSLCTAVTPAYERFGYTAVFTFHRASRDVDLQFQFRNECSDAAAPPWRDDSVEVRYASWRWPFEGTVPAPRTAFHVGGGPLVSSSAGFDGVTVVEQSKGAGNPWQRRARVTRDGADLETGTAFEAPFVAVQGGGFLAALQMPWMRFREPQALAVDGAALEARSISETTRIGEGKGVWSQQRLHLASQQLTAPFGGPTPWLEDRRARGRAALERGLLVHSPPDHLDGSALFAPIAGSPAVSAPEAYYRASLDFIHQETLRPGGQWDRNRTFGSQLWPDIQLDPFSAAPTPADNAVRSNYWNPLGAELWEWLRTGEPAWAWDFALPQAWHHAFANFLNLGHASHGNRNGFSVAGTGTGEGDWNRNGNLSSDDYNYNMGMQLAYALRPNLPLRHRFDQAGLTARDRYNIPWSQQGDREPFVSAVDLSRGVIQNFEHLANCAEFSPGQRGRDCHDRLMELATELMADNASSGVLCGGDLPDFAAPCSTPQQFMLNSHIYHFFHRLYLNYGDLGGALRRALVETPRAFYQYGIPKGPDGVSIDIAAPWPNGMDCTLTAGGGAVVGCTGWTGGEPTYLENFPQTVSLLLMAHGLDPSADLCGVARDALESLTTARALDGYLWDGAGWWKGSAQMMQGLVFAPGLAETCADP